MGQSEEQLESQWDKMLKIKTTGRDDSHADAFCYPYEPTPYCVLEIMEQEREECVFFFHIRRAAIVLVLSMMSVFLQEQNKTEKMRFQVRVHNLFLQMQKVMKYHQM